MKKLWDEFYKTVLGPQRAAEDISHPRCGGMMACYHQQEGKTRVEEMHQWEDYAIKNYREELPDVANKLAANKLTGYV